MLLPQVFHRFAQGFVEAQRCNAFGAETGAASVGAFDGDFVVAEVCVIEYLHGNALRVAVVVEFAFDRFESKTGFDDLVDMFGGKFAVFIAKVFSQFAV